MKNKVTRVKVSMKVSVILEIVKLRKLRLARNKYESFKISS